MQAYNLMNDGSTDVLRAVITGEGDIQTFPINSNQEIWVHKSMLNKLWGTNPDDPTAKVSVGVTKILEIKQSTDPNYGKYDVSLIMGCY